MQTRRSFGKSSPLRVGRRIVLIIIIALVRIGVALTRPISLKETVIVKKWDTLNAFMKQLSWREKMKLKAYIKTHEIDLGNIQLGTYEFSGSYKPQEFLEVIKMWPASEYIRYTVLEWWSIYDIDASLAEKWVIEKWSYIAYVSSGAVIGRAGEWYSYIADAYATHAFPSLEWRLYPDTYFIDPTKDPINQLVRLQLQAFDEKVYEPYKTAITAFPSLLQAKWIELSFTMDLRNILRLATVVEKEERNLQNKPTVAWIFFNRLEQWTLLGADITLCYGLHQPYETCTPSLIGQHVADTENPYNTRMQRWLPPTPIANPSVDTIRSVLEFAKTDYFFYIHDNNGIIRYAEDIQWHNDNISKYLK